MNQEKLAGINELVNQCIGCEFFNKRVCPNQIRRSSVKNIESMTDSDGILTKIVHGAKKSDESNLRKDIKAVRKSCNHYEQRK
jgi:hypothetical protein